MLVDLNDDVLMLVDPPDDMWIAIAKQLAESDLASAVALKRCSSRFKDLATPLVANAVERTDEKWRDAAAKIGGRGAATITGGLECNEVLTELRLGVNGIGDKGAKALASALRVNAVLKSLSLRFNGIRDAGAAAIAEALRGNGVLTTLDISYNRIGREGAKAVGEALAVNGVLKSINLNLANLNNNNRVCGASRETFVT